MKMYNPATGEVMPEVVSYWVAEGGLEPIIDSGRVRRQVRLRAPPRVQSPSLEQQAAYQPRPRQ